MSYQAKILDNFLGLMVEKGPDSPEVLAELEKYKDDTETHSLMETCRMLCKALSLKWGNPQTAEIAPVPRGGNWKLDLALGLMVLVPFVLSYLAYFVQSPTKDSLTFGTRVFVTLFWGIVFVFYLCRAFKSFKKEHP